MAAGFPAARRARAAMLAAFSLVATTLAFGAGPASPAAAAPSLPKPSYLFTVEAASGSTTITSDRSRPERLTLTLDGVRPVTMFADRPFRKATLISPAALAANWPAWFASSPPNAVLTWEAEHGTAPDSIVVALTRAAYDATSRSLTFTAVRDRREHDPAERGANWQRRTTPAGFTGASLFIDNTGSVVVNGCTIASGAQCPGADLSGATIPYLQISNANFAGANMQRVYAPSTLFMSSDFTGADFTDADFGSTIFAGSTLDGVVAPGVRLANVASSTAIGANFAGADMSGLHASGSDLSKADFSNATMTYGDLTRVKFTGANLTGANLTGSPINAADFHYANLTGAKIDNIAYATTDQSTICPSGQTGPCAAWTPGPDDLPNPSMDGREGSDGS